MKPSVRREEGRKQRTKRRQSCLAVCVCVCVYSGVALLYIYIDRCGNPRNSFVSLGIRLIDAMRRAMVA